MDSINDIYFIEDDMMIIDMEKFYDRLTLVRENSIDFKEESRMLLEMCLNMSRKQIYKNTSVVLRYLFTPEVEINSIDKFEEWMNNECNIKLGLRDIILSANKKPFMMEEEVI